MREGIGVDFEPWMLAAIDEAGYNGIEEDDIARIAEELPDIDFEDLDEDDFRDACYRAGIDPDNFSEEDMEALMDYLDEI